MKKFKSILVAAGLLVVTAGVFAGKPKFATGLYINVSGVPTQISSSYSTSQLTTTGTTNQVRISHGATSFAVYGDDAFSQPLYTTGTW